MGFSVEPNDIVGCTQDHQQNRCVVVRQATDTACRIWRNLSQIPIQPCFQLIPELRADDIPRLVLLGRFLAQAVQVFIGQVQHTLSGQFFLLIFFVGFRALRQVGFGGADGNSQVFGYLLVGQPFNHK